jgi:EAL domain-containing protein (putative c-di-GMP-specific phosphodiesterase class I)
LRSGLTRRLWLIITLAMLIPVSLALFSRWFEAEERRASLENQELTSLSREKASTLLFNSREIPSDFARGLEGRFLIVLDGVGTTRFSSSPVPEELLQLIERRAPNADDAQGRTTILAWYASGREWRGAMTHLQPGTPENRLTASTVVVFAPEATMASTASDLVPTALALLALSIVIAFAVSAIVSERYLPPLRALQHGLALLRDRRFETLPSSAVEEFTHLEREFNNTAMALQRDWRAFEVLGEVDRALLAASEIDRALDIVLPKFRELTRAQCVGVILLDPTAHAHGLCSTRSRAVELPAACDFDSSMIATVRGRRRHTWRASKSHAMRSGFRVTGAEFSGCGRWWTTIGSPPCDHWLSQRAGARSGDRRYGAAFAERAGRALQQRSRRAPLSQPTSVHDPAADRALFRVRLGGGRGRSHRAHARARQHVDLIISTGQRHTGHSAGDRLLSIVARAQSACEGRHRRAGGDEFPCAAVGCQSRAHHRRTVIRRSLPSSGGRESPAAERGAAVPGDGVISKTSFARRISPCRAGAQGRGRAIFFEREMVQKRASFSDSGLHRALRRRELALFYQPQFSLADNRLCGAEALLRWQTRYDGIKLPGEFIPAAEHSGLITDIGAFVLDSACAQYAEWAHAGIAPRMFSVNVSVQQIKDSNFVRMVQGSLLEHGISPASLELEFKEAALSDLEVEEPLRAIAALGVKLALDDFGTGNSSLNYLRRYPVHTVKLDRSFLDEIPQNDSAGALVESVITMAHTLGKRVTAEGVESSGQLEFLRSRGCEAAQGFYLARPMSAAALTEILESRRPGSEIDDARAAG